MQIFNKFKIHFIVIGTQKAGTSALDFYLRQHPKIKMASQKELHFFDNDRYFRNNRNDYEVLKSYYPIREKKYVYGEVTPSYMYLDNSLERIKRYNPKIKLIAILRNPIDRAYSNWNMERHRGNEIRSFGECLDCEMVLIKEGKKEKSLYKSYLDRGLYSNQIEKIYNLFPKNQVHIIKYENYAQNQEQTVSNVLTFLGLNDGYYHFKEHKRHSITYQKEMNDDDRRKLYDFFKKDIEIVEHMLNWDCSDWK